MLHFKKMMGGKYINYRTVVSYPSLIQLFLVAFSLAFGALNQTNTACGLVAKPKPSCTHYFFPTKCIEEVNCIV